jgi:hypothetical protein
MVDVKRPWQGTALGIMDIIGVVGAFLLIIVCFGFWVPVMGIPVPAFIVAIVTFSQGSYFFTALLIIIAIILIGLGILAIFMARGAFKGQKWSPILSIVFGALGLFSSLNGLLFASPKIPAPPNTVSVVIINIVITLFMLYCAYICVKDPFYNKK